MKKLRNALVILLFVLSGNLFSQTSKTFDRVYLEAKKVGEKNIINTKEITSTVYFLKEKIKVEDENNYYEFDIKNRTIKDGKIYIEIQSSSYEKEWGVISFDSELEYVCFDFKDRVVIFLNELNDK